MTDSGALRSRRYRLHNTGDHSLCGSCDKGAIVRKVPSGLGWPTGKALKALERDHAKRAPYIPPSKRGTCSQCGKTLYLGRGSRPDPTCLECRRSQPEYRAQYRVPCSECGKQMHRSTRPGHATAETPVCLECRRKRPEYRNRQGQKPRIYEPRRCDVCHHVYVPRDLRSRTCGRSCARELQRSYRRNMSSLRYAMIQASANLLDPLTPEIEAAMRRAARKCPLCKVWMTSKPYLPNSKELDHIVPRCLDGAHTIGNTRIICRLCNARRPDDGSDIGQLDLFSTVDPAAVALAQQPRIRQPRQLPKPPSRRPCVGCGATTDRPGRRAWCTACVAENAQRAAELRIEGMKWQAISDLLGLGGPGVAFKLAHRYDEAA